MLRDFMDTPVFKENPRKNGLACTLTGLFLLLINVWSMTVKNHTYPWALLFGCIGLQYGLWLLIFGVPRDRWGSPKKWWAYTGFTLLILSMGLGIYLGFFHWL